MKCRNKVFIYIWIILFCILTDQSYSSEQIISDTTINSGFLKTEINTGFLLYRNNSREGLSSDLETYQEKRYNYNADFLYSQNRWKFTAEKHQEINFISAVGPVFATGTSTLSNSDGYKILDDKINGINLLGEIKYAGRFYYDSGSYALVEVDGNAQFELINKQSEGYMIRNYFGRVLGVEENSSKSRLRYGIKTKAGWGMGRPKIVNYRMTADFLLDKFYKGRLYSEVERLQFASEIGRLKNNRIVSTGHDISNEAEQIGQYLNKKMLLRIPDNLAKYMMYGEFSPRYDGHRVEAGPLFIYYNREPDFIYGGFIKYENDKYMNFRWNRSFKTELSYNRYKTRDWLRWETNLSVDYYTNLRSQYSVGIKYIPITVVNDFTNIEPVQHVLIPYLEYYTQLNDKLRMNLTFSYNITDDNDFFMKGPEFSLAFYRSRY